LSIAEAATAGPEEVEVKTACGGKLTLTDDTPRVFYQGRAVYFCLKECKATFEDDPHNSCLVEQVHTQDN
jgi:YHS domain-containing protein